MPPIVSSPDRCRSAREAGNSLVETALVLPLVLALTFAIADFAALLYAYLALENGVSLATRYAVTGNRMDDPDNPGQTLSREDSIKIAMRTATPTLTIDDEAFTFRHLPAGGDTWRSGAGEPGDIAKVSVDYRWTFYTPVIRPLFENGQMRITVESAMKNESRFQ